MVMRADVAAAAIDAVTPAAARRGRCSASPRAARPWSRSGCANWPEGPGAILFCARFEGLDERVIKARRMEEVSLGDFVLAGGEVAAMALIEACVRLIPGVLGEDAVRRRGEFRAGLAGISAVYPAPDLRGGRDPAGARLGRPCGHRPLAQGRGRAPYPGSAGPISGPSMKSAAYPLEGPPPHLKEPPDGGKK